MYKTSLRFIALMDHYLVSSMANVTAISVDMQAMACTMIFFDRPIFKQHGYWHALCTRATLARLWLAQVV